MWGHEWGVNVVTAPSQHAAAVVCWCCWWGRCSPFKLCLSPAADQFLCYLHVLAAVFIPDILLLQNGVMYLEHPRALTRSGLSHKSHVIECKCIMKPTWLCVDPAKNMLTVTGNSNGWNSGYNFMLSGTPYSMRKRKCICYANTPNPNPPYDRRWFKCFFYFWGGLR